LEKKAGDEAPAERTDKGGGVPVQRGCRHASPCASAQPQEFPPAPQHRLTSASSWSDTRLGGRGPARPGAAPRWGASLAVGLLYIDYFFRLRPPSRSIPSRLGM
jgi:hypothetical protein